MNRTLLTSVVVIGLLGAAGCAVTDRQSTVGQYVDDATITTRVKTRMAEDPQVSAIAHQRRDAERHGAAVGLCRQRHREGARGPARPRRSGVKDVRNNINVRTGN